ncbi:DegT/DnrJ/EryC1/StrS family aminotransferase [Geobacter pickeringii]|uniref:Erythromycin biosynthesis sensory transduction protein eryC1 n=1 Tax=Geobacter pickeringii TaxID=345632 RepID=A0A0B5BEZ7_9BACT|nr:DegT/DnrJ/EryC1/StrS family aminotransferase [Geobacter pickeringii]AJE03719.1 erythromycin biosynthesis sensory transduction protein eryC1 [Geobacter pickeringii]
MIPMVDLKVQYLQIKEEIDRGILEALEKTQFILGPNVAAFEEEAAACLGVKHAVGVASGTDALHLALAAAGIKEGDEVITSPFTFIATAEAIRYVGATPVFVDIDPKTYNIDPARIEAAITPRTRAVLPVHLFGQPADLSAIEALCTRHGLLLIEDCAQSFGADFGGRMTGTIGALGAFSFFPSKNLGCYGDGGLVTTPCPEMAERVKVLRNHGSKVRYHHSVIGYNSRLDEIQAVILRVKLKHIKEYSEGRRRVAHLYSELLAGTGAITPHEDGKGTHVYHQYTILTERRDAVMKALSEAGIASAVYYPIPLHKQEVFAAECAGVSLPVAEEVASRCMSLPIFPEMTDAQVREVAAVVASVLKG